MNIQIGRFIKIIIIVTVIFIFFVIYLIYSQTNSVPVSKPTFYSPKIIHKPSASQLREAFTRATYDIDNGQKIVIPIEQLINYSELFFYPPNGYEYSGISVRITDYVRDEDKCREDFCRKLIADREKRDQKKYTYVFLSGWYDGHQDTFVISYMNTLSNAGNPIIGLGYPSFDVSQSLRNSIIDLVSTNKYVKEFIKANNKYIVSVYFYRSGYYQVDPNVMYASQIFYSGLDASNNYFIVRYDVSGNPGIPEIPRTSLTVYVNPLTMKVVKTVNK